MSSSQPLAEPVPAMLVEPAGHGTARSAPASQKLPSGHASHIVWPAHRWYSPAVQASQCPVPPGDTLPGAHTSGTEEPDEHAAPGGHTQQSAADEPPE